MNLLELLGEQFNRGPVGTIEWGNEQEPEEPDDRFVWLKFIIGVVLLLGAEYVIIVASTNLTEILFFNLVVVLYHWLAYRITIRPEMSNTGFIPFVDHPFRFSDDFNRTQFFFLVFLWPGKFVTHSIFRFIRHQKR